MARCRAWCVPLLATLALVSPVAAQQQPPGESERALPALYRVGLPTPTSASVVTALGAGYGWMDDTTRINGGHRLGGHLAAAFTLGFGFTLGGDVRGWWDRYSDGPDGPESNLYGEPRLTARYANAATPRVHWGAEGDVRFIGAEAPSVEFDATSPALRGLLALLVGPRSWLGFNLGFRLDRSARAVPDPAALSGPDERSINASSWNALEWGAGVSHRLVDDRTELLGEVTGESLVGSDAPGVARSPMRVTLGARRALTRELSLVGHVDVGLSGRTLAGANLMPVDPRLQFGATLVWRLGMDPEPPPKRPEPSRNTPKVQSGPDKPVKAPPGPPPPVTSPVSGTVVDEGGRPLADVEVKLVRQGVEPLVERTYANGGFEFVEIPRGAVQLQVSTPGFDPVTLTIGDEGPRNQEIVLRPAVPAGQVRGRVLDLQGQPIVATITITPGDHRVDVRPDGSFDLELAPGTYTVKFQHEDYTTQRRSIRVHDRGVVILNIALTR